MSNRTDNPRPRLGRRKVEGLATLVAMFHQWVKVGFIPSGFTPKDRRAAAQALDYVRQLVAWYEVEDGRRRDVDPPPRLTRAIGERGECDCDFPGGRHRMDCAIWGDTPAPGTERT